MIPVIGITQPFSTEGAYSRDAGYVSSVIRAGGIPILLPYETDCIEEYLKMISGLLLSGGGDIDPCHFGEKPHQKTGAPCAKRDAFELEICRKALERDMPVLGICRGAQLLNVVLGGNLLQHIDGHSPSNNTSVPESGFFEYVHEIEIYPNTLLHNMLGITHLAVNSSHHQSVGDNLGADIIISAKSPEGIVEAIEVQTKKFTLGVQWHPEDLSATDSNHAVIFEGFINAALSFLC